MNYTKIAVNLFNKYAVEYQNKFMDISLYSETIDFFCNMVKSKNANILELACGPGNVTKYLLNKRPDFKLLGIDLAPNMLKLAKINNPTAEFKLMDCRHINLIEKKYDAIISGFCLPYLNKEESIKLIAHSSKLLKYNGILYLSTMEDDYSKSSFKKGSSGDEIFMHYHQADYLTEALKKNNFILLDLQRKTYTNDDKSAVVDLILIAQKQNS